MSRFTVALSGLADNDVGRVRTALESADLKDWQLVDGVDADVLIVDIDSVWGHMDWLKATANGQRTVACSDQDDLRDHDLKLAKPLIAEMVIDLLQSLETADHSKPVAAEPVDDAPAESPAAAEAPAATPVTAPEPAKPEPAAAQATAAVEEPAEETVAVPEPEPEPAPRPATLGAWLLSRQIDTAFTVDGKDGTTLTVDPSADIYIGPAQLKPLQNLLDMPSESAQPIDGEAAASAGPSQPLSRLVWFAALCSTPGELAPPITQHTVCKLNRWPQIEREFPRHFRIATAMMKQAATLGELATAANVPEADVADFINAYHATGYVDVELAADDAATDAGMLSRLRNPFARGASSS